MAASRILVVDDDDDIRGLLRTLLERAGHEVSDASDGRAGLRELYAGAPDLVILDVAMPGLDGWETLERIREVSDVPVLILTARDAELEGVRGLRGKAVRAPGTGRAGRRAPPPAAQRRRAGHVRRRTAQHLVRATCRALRR